MKGATFYTFILVFMVAFVAVVGLWQRATVTGNVILQTTLPPLEDPLDSVIEAPALPLPAFRTAVTPNADISEESLYAFAPPRHFFPGVFTTDLTPEEASALAAQAERVPVYHTYEPGDVLLKGKIAIIDTGVNDGVLVGCKDFTHGPTVREECSDEHGHGSAIASLNENAEVLAYKVCDSQGYCLADDIAAAVRYATAEHVDAIVLVLEGPAFSLLDDALVAAREEGILIQS
ncbi:MAG TPA: hypothetical protein VJK52_00275 [Candidatus Nanoarchaeia archaeon]|nr:hypothetical protein [Candidatus Nanoarchaeia archaeon]